MRCSTKAIHAHARSAWALQDGAVQKAGSCRRAALLDACCFAPRGAYYPLHRPLKLVGRATRPKFAHAVPPEISAAARNAGKGLKLWVFDACTHSRKAPPLPPPPRYAPWRPSKLKLSGAGLQPHRVLHAPLRRALRARKLTRLSVLRKLALGPDSCEQAPLARAPLRCFRATQHDNGSRVPAHRRCRLGCATAGLSRFCVRGPGRRECVLRGSECS